MRIGMPRYLVISALEESGLTPDDLLIEPCDKRKEVDLLWDYHDGRTAGSMVVGVYKLRDLGDGRYDYIRDESYGILGDIRKTGPAGEGDTVS